jgi:hypothetical protein
MRRQGTKHLPLRKRVTAYGVLRMCMCGTHFRTIFGHMVPRLSIPVKGKWMSVLLSFFRLRGVLKMHLGTYMGT